MTAPKSVTWGSEPPTGEPRTILGPPVAQQVVAAGFLDRLDCPADDRAAIERALDWARTFLTAPNPAIGRNGPVCPYIEESFERDHLFVSYRSDEECTDRALRAGLLECSGIFLSLQDQVEADERHLVAMVIVLPHVDVSTPGPLDDLQADLKGRFVEQGLMIGQFHPLCEASGLWRHDFRPLQSPVPLLAIREMVASDLPFLMGDPDHAAMYFRLFAPRIPSHIRRHLVESLVSGPPTAGGSPESGASSP